MKDIYNLIFKLIDKFKTKFIALDFDECLRLADRWARISNSSIKFNPLKIKTSVIPSFYYSSHWKLGQKNPTTDPVLIFSIVSPHTGHGSQRNITNSI